MNDITVFEGQEISVITDKGQKLINLVHVAKSCGLFEVKGNKEYVNWKQAGGVVKKFKKIISEDIPKQYLEEINYILDEIENTDDRNSIYISSWLAKRLAVECHSEKANKFKNFLVTLDEKRERSELIVSNNEVASLVGQTVKSIVPTLVTEITKQFAPIIVETKNQVNTMTKLMYDQSIIYDQDREDLKALIGLRAVNTKKLTDKLKERLSEAHGKYITASSLQYINAKNKVFKEFKVTKWEDVPSSKYNAVYAYIDETI
ncbi:hypothetical protein SAMN02745163_03717 [Clostridium cavendishii DSM 21758]|uniref:Uncharacterized protein n=1 Tax=Clostridium cavendishii DSM 21758 TaxID=1121302 RepID=A0A1M6S084_9CLOT|nr:hypothetical protein [Clostridium cavendishii]SHK38123.1 hypothetical protein SAMN02745163_03717 [Clostridium cavendishii DSM 21758]